MMEELLTRAYDRPPVSPDGAAPLHTLTTKQRALLIIIERYYKATGEACPGRYLARRLNVHHSTVQQQLAELHRKGWLRSPSAPSAPARDVA